MCMHAFMHHLDQAPIDSFCNVASSKADNKVLSLRACTMNLNKACIQRDWTRRLSLLPPPLRGEVWHGGTSHSDPVTILPTGTTARQQSDTPSPEPSPCFVVAKFSKFSSTMSTYVDSTAATLEDTKLASNWSQRFQVPPERYEVDQGGSEWKLRRGK